MADLPILFSGAMVRALLDGRKTMTRRRLTSLRGHCYRRISEFGPSDTKGYDWHFRDKDARWHDLRHAELLDVLPCRAGDRLWVREKFLPDPPADDESWNDNSCSYVEWSGCGSRLSDVPKKLRDASCCIFGADPDYRDYQDWRWRPSIHMPRWASRLTLVVENVKVERLQDVREADAVAEGVEPFTDFLPAGHWRRYRDGGWNSYVDSAIASFASLWTEINGPGSWEGNPWVAAYTFRVVRHNIDAIGGAP